MYDVLGVKDWRDTVGKLCRTIYTLEELATSCPTKKGVTPNNGKKCLDVKKRQIMISKSAIKRFLYGNDIAVDYI